MAIISQSFWFNAIHYPTDDLHSASTPIFIESLYLKLCFVYLSVGLAEHFLFLHNATTIYKLCHLQLTSQHCYLCASC